MGSVAVLANWVVALNLWGQSLSPQEIDQQNQNFRRYWHEDLVWKFSELPEKGQVPEYRIPYSGCIYLDRNGGTVNALKKYDQAFTPGQYPATRHEQWDTTAFQRPIYQTRRTGLFSSGQVMVGYGTPHWHGHCNGWSAATVRHAEPQQNVVRNGVTFTPADIKALLAEIYIYQDTLDLAGEYGVAHPAMLHVGLANWIGRFSHTLAMEAEPGKEKWNFPVYAYSTSHARRGERAVEVKLNLRYAYYTNKEEQKSPRLARDKYFHYELRLDDQGKIVGGSYYRDSSRIDLLWVPLHAIQGGQKGNERGNRYVDVNKVVAIWRESVPDDLVARWVNIDSEALPPAVDPPAIVAVTEGAAGLGEQLAPLTTAPATTPTTIAAGAGDTAPASAGP